MTKITHYLYLIILKTSPFLKANVSSGNWIKAAVFTKLAKSPEPFPAIGKATIQPFLFSNFTCKKYVKFGLKLTSSPKIAVSSSVSNPIDF
jgi:hypothetical protein